MTMRREYRRTKISATESAELWERWKKGEGLHAIGQALRSRFAQVSQDARALFASGTVLLAGSALSGVPSARGGAAPVASTRSSCG